MNQIIVRLQSLELNNIKNVKFGRIEMPNTFCKNLDYHNSEILGLYGQNGSGKTAVIDALYFLQQIIMGRSMDKSFTDYIDMTGDTAELNSSFAIFSNDIAYEVGYKICFRRTKELFVIIEKESLSCSKIYEGKRSNKTVFMEFKRDDEAAIFTPKKRLDELLNENKEYKTDLIVARKMAEKNNCSYVFGDSSREIFFKECKYDFKAYSFILNALFRFALRDLFVIRNSHSGVITANFVLPMAFRIDGDENGIKGDFAVSLTEPTVLDTERMDVLRQIVHETNTVLYTIIPGLKIKIKEYGSQLMDDGKDGYKIELLSSREGIPPFPIRMESEGIIKIISILNALIQAFGNESICLAIDELDAGIFEYMLGELLDIFDKSAKGQLLFTSHNLRALEMLDKESIMFSTANPENRYIHMKNIKYSNNLRDVYLRSITLGGQNEEIYKETDSLKIARAFRKAGRSVKNGG